MAADDSRPYTVFIEGNVGSGKTTFLEQFADCPNVYTAKEPLHKWQDVRGHNFLVSVRHFRQRRSGGGRRFGRRTEYHRRPGREIKGRHF